MTGVNKGVIIAVVASFGLWGCARGPGGSAAAERIKALEQKVVKLEDDFRAVASARDTLRQRLSAVEDQRALLEKDVAILQVVVKERDDLRKQLSNRTAERDSVQVQFDQFRKGLRELLGQADTAAAAATLQPVSASAPLLAAGKS
jgi:hypothetical protein